jgi:integrin beta 3
MLDVTKFVGELHDYIGRALAPIADRLKRLEDRAPERGEKGEQGQTGRDGIDGATGVAGEPGQPGERGEKGEPGERGEAGKDAEPVDVAAVADAVIAKLLASDRLKTLAEVSAASAVAEHFEANPIQHGRDGKDGERGMQGERGVQGDAGQRGTDGADGVGMAGAIIDRTGALVITTTKGDAIPLGCVVGKDGEAGKDGRDGFSLDDLAIEDDGDGTITLRFIRGDLLREKQIRYPRGDRGVFKDGETYRKGDGATFGGSWWVAQVDSPEGSPGVSKDWRLAVKKGRDGKDGRNGIDKTAPAKLEASK